MSTMSNEALPVVLSNLPRRLNDIETFQLPRLRACLGPLDLHRELVEELRGDLDSIKYKLEVAQELYESTSGSQKEAHHAQIDELNTQYTSYVNAHIQYPMSTAYPSALML
ncbi:hypothetical protein I317_03457 [Kwoniella heveanensis CBS 569]|uniref:Uncharacterized protein n=1 Tax=Kwoniella heveanensis BCC8398 TaxID=1296120 RepID=A0A1B9H3Q5_9TREE|nr:hypothetical protein I316_00104 [Kwoniella heveanensis BCC8398]OCF42726.1 hypothetical protein I317_03457 [Kwoniella heveanensis CBS 569]